MEPIRATKSGTCPHCLVVVLFQRAEAAVQIIPRIPTDRVDIFSSGDGLRFHVAECPNCHRVVASVEQRALDASGEKLASMSGTEFLCWPLLGATRPVPPEVPASIAKDYRQAGLIVSLSPEASAALSRRCLQSILKERGYNQEKLWQQINAAKANLPSYVADELVHIRLVGNNAAHENTDTATKEIIEVEPGEAEWNLTILALLFDHYYVYPAKAKEMRDAALAKEQAAKAPKKP